MNRQTRILLGLAAAICATSAPARSEGMKITLLNPFVGDEFWQGCSVGAGNAAKGGRGDPHRARRQQLLADAGQPARRCPADTSRMRSLFPRSIRTGSSRQLNRAMQAGIDVYAYNTAAPNAKLRATVAMDEEATGAAAAERFVDLLKARSQQTGQKTFKLLHLVGAVATEAGASPPRRIQQGDRQARRRHHDRDGRGGHRVEAGDSPSTGCRTRSPRGPIDAIFTESDFLTPVPRPGSAPAPAIRPDPTRQALGHWRARRHSGRPQGHPGRLADLHAQLSNRRHVRERNSVGSRRRKRRARASPQPGRPRRGVRP